MSPGVQRLFLLVLLATLAGCGGSGGSDSPFNGSITITVQDANTGNLVPDVGVSLPNATTVYTDQDGLVTLTTSSPSVDVTVENHRLDPSNNSFVTEFHHLIGLGSDATLEVDRAGAVVPGPTTTISITVSPPINGQTLVLTGSVSNTTLQPPPSAPISVQTSVPIMILGYTLDSLTGQILRYGVVDGASDCSVLSNCALVLTDAGDRRTTAVITVSPPSSDSTSVAVYGSRPGQTPLLLGQATTSDSQGTFAFDILTPPEVFSVMEYELVAERSRFSPTIQFAQESVTALSPAGLPDTISLLEYPVIVSSSGTVSWEPVAGAERYVVVTDRADVTHYFHLPPTRAALALSADAVLATVAALRNFGGASFYTAVPRTGGYAVTATP